MHASKIDAISDGTNTIEYAYDGKLYSGETLNGTLNASIALHYNNDYLPDQVTYAGETTELDYDGDGLLINAGPVLRSFGMMTMDCPNLFPDNSLTLNRSFNGYGEIAAQSFSISDPG